MSDSTNDRVAEPTRDLSLLVERLLCRDDSRFAVEFRVELGGWQSWLNDALVSVAEGRPDTDGEWRDVKLLSDALLQLCRAADRRHRCPSGPGGS